MKNVLMTTLFIFAVAVGAYFVSGATKSSGTNAYACTGDYCE